MVHKSLFDVESDEAVNLLKEVMGNAIGREKSVAFWNWKHIENPAGNSIGTAAYSDGGDLIAIRPFMRWKLIDHNGTTISAVRAVDTVVHPRFQGKGIFSKLTKEALEELKAEKIDLIFNTPNGNSSPGYRKMGWQLLGNPSLNIKILKPINFILKNNQKVDIEHSPFKNPNEWHDYITKHEEFTKRTGRYILPENCLGVNKDDLYLKWRYADNPNLKYWYYSKHDNKLESVCTAVAREDVRGRHRGLVIVELLGKKENESPVKLLNYISKITNVDYILIKIDPMFNKYAPIINGFIPIRWKNVNLAVKPVCLDPDLLYFKDPNKWCMGLGDLEAF